MCCFIILFTVLGPTISHAAGQSQVLEFINDETQTTRIVNVHTESFAEKTGDLKNPDRGLYHIHQFIIEDTPKGLDYYKADIEWFLSEQGNPNDKSHTLTLVEIDLKNYRDRDITASALTDIDTLLSVYQTGGRKIILRFLYDVNGETVQTENGYLTVAEPDSIDVILKHMEQLSPYLKKYKDMIFTIQGLFTGTWGEMHSTKFGSDEDMRTLAKKLEEVTDPDTFLCVRTPAQRRAVTKNGEDTALARRMGLYNDGMLGSETDLGTYLESTVPTENGGGRWHREEELNYQDTVCASVPQGGQVVTPNPYNDFETAVRDMARMHVTYIDQYWQTEVLNKWNAARVPESFGVYAGKSGLDYVRDHLGYRLMADGLSVSVSDSASQTANVSVRFRNTGFAPLYAKPTVTLAIKAPDGSVETYPMTNDLTSLTGCAHPEQRGTAQATVPMSEFKNGNYDLYVNVSVPGMNAAEVPLYLANTQVRDESLGYRVGGLTLSDGVYQETPDKPGIQIRYFVSGMEETDGPFTSVYRIDVTDESGKPVYSNLYTADVTGNGNGKLIADGISIPEDATVTATLLYAGASLGQAGESSPQACSYENGYYSAYFELNKTGIARGYGVCNFYHMEGSSGAIMPATGMDQVSKLLALGSALFCAGLAGMVLLRRGKRKAIRLFGILCTCLLLVPVCTAYASEIPGLSWEQKWTVSPDRPNAEMAETIDGFTKHVTLTNKSAKPVTARVKAFSPDGYLVRPAENTAWTKDADGWIVFDGDLPAGGSTDELLLEILDKDGNPVDTAGGGDPNIIVVHEMEAVALPAPTTSVSITNDEELTVDVTFSVPTADVPFEAATHAELSYEDIQIPLLDDAPNANLNGRLISVTGDLDMEKTVTYRWVLDSLVTDKDGNPQRFKDLFPDPSVPFGNHFTVNSEITITADGFAPRTARASADDNSLYHKSTGDGPTAYLSNVRHLQNLDAVTSFTNGQANAVQIADIDAGTYKGKSYEFLPIVPAGALAGYSGKHADTEWAIRGLHVTTASASNPNKAYAGLFCSVQNFKFEDVHLENANIEAGARHSGALVGYLDWGPTTITNCHVHGTMVSSQGACAGGLAGFGWVYQAAFHGCSAEAVAVTADGSYAGGLMGGCGNGGDGKAITFTDCTAGTEGTVSITGTEAGGLIGDVSCNEGLFTNCTAGKYLTATGVNYAGGLAGLSQNTVFEGCLADEAKISQTNTEGSAGGLAGRTTNSTFHDCSSIKTTVDGSMDVGGMAGSIIGNKTSPSVTDCRTEDVVLTCLNFGGGLTGNSTNATYENCEALRPSVTASNTEKSEVGGLLGRIVNTDVRNCNAHWENYASADAGSVYGNAAGGLIGTIREFSTITDSFASMNVRGITYGGGLIGNLSNPDDPEKTTQVSIQRAYAHCDTNVTRDVIIPDYPLRVAGLVGVKNNRAKVDITDVYVAGNVSYSKAPADYVHSYLFVSGTDYPKEDVTITNAYAVIYDECYYSWEGTYTNCKRAYYNYEYRDLLAVGPLSDAFEASTDGYPYCVLRGLPRFGDYTYITETLAALGRAAKTPVRMTPSDGSAENGTETRAPEPTEEDTETRVPEPTEGNTETRASEPTEDNVEAFVSEPVEDGTETWMSETTENDTP